MAMTLRNIRVDDDLWIAAGERAAEEGTALSVVIRQLLEDYVAGDDAIESRAKVTAERDALLKTLDEIADVIGLEIIK